MTGYFALAPEFPAGAATVVDVDEVRLVLRRTSDSTVALDTTVQMAAEDSVVDLSFEIVVKEANETFWLEIECFDEAGNLVFAAGPLEVMATTSGEVEAQDVEIEYVGVGSDAVAVEILDPEVFIEFGETYTLQAQSLDGQGVPIPGTPIKWISHDVDRVIVPDPGVAQIQGGSVRGWAHVEAQLLTGPSDLVDVFVEPMPNSITVVSGDGQTGLTNTTLADPIVVQVDAVDGPMSGVLVDFTTADGGSFSPLSGTTGGDGRLQTLWTLGSAEGSQTGTATATDWPAVDGSFSATAVVPAGTIYWLTPTDGNWSDPGNWNTGRIPADTDVVAIDIDGTYTVTLDIISRISGLVLGGFSGTQTLLVSDTLALTGDGTVGENGVMVLDGGAYNGTGQLSVTGELRWQSLSGVINSTFGAGTTRIEPTGTFSLAGNINRFWGGHTIENFGSTSWTDGRVDASEGATFINRAGGTVEALGSSPFQLIPGGSEPRFVNEGTLIRNGEFTVKMQVPFDNDGLVEVQSGYLAITAGGMGTGSFISQANLNFGEPGGDPYTLTASSSVDGSGTVTFAGFAGFTAPHVVSGTYAVTGLTLINGTRVAFSAADTSTTRTLLLRGDIEGTGTLVVMDTLTWDRGTMTGTGSLDVARGGAMSLQPGNGAKAILGGRTVRNYGEAIWTGEDVTIADGSVFRNEPGGTFEVQADYSFLSGTGGGTFVNAGRLTKYVGADTVTFGIPFNNQGKMDVRSGTVLLNGGGSFTDTVYIALGAVLDLAGSHTLTDGLHVSDTSSMWAPGTLRISGDASTSGRDTVVTSVDITGSLHVAADTFVFTGVQARGSASGSVTIASDAVLEFYYAEFSFAPSSAIEGPGTLLAKRSAVDVAGSYSVGLTDISALSQGGMVNFNADSSTTADLIIREGGERAGTGLLVVTDTFDFRLGDLDGPSVTRIAPTGVLIMTPGRLNTISGGHRLQNEGVINVASGGLRLRNGGRIYNRAGGVIDIQADDFAVSWEGFNNYINNSGTVRKSAGTGTSSVSAAVLFSNDAGGVVDVQSGTLSIGDFTGYAGSRVQGNGTLELGTVRLFEGDANPGTSPGVLNIAGALPQGTSSTFNIELNGPNVGTEHDQLNISGLATLNGSLNVTTSFAPQLGQTFTVLTFASRTGEFSDTTGLSIPGNLEFDLVWNATSLDLVVVDASPVSPADVIFFSDSGGGLDYGIFTNSADGSSLLGVADIASSTGFLITPRWSTDRQRIAFTSDATGSNNLYMATSTGAELTELVNAHNSGYPRWSHNGQRLGFICRTGTAALVDHVCVIPDVTGPISSIPVNSHAMPTAAMPAAWQTGPPAASWDPRPASQDRFLFARDSGVTAVSKFFSMNYDGTGLDTITTDVMQGASGPLQVLEMDVSLDGSTVVFAGRDTQSLTERLYVVNTDGTGLRQLTFPTGTAYDERPIFQPVDGSEVLFGRRDDFCNLTYWIVDINNTNGSLERQITSDVLSCEMDPYDQVGMDWSPTADRIVLVGLVDILQPFGWWRLYVVPSDVTPATYESVRVPVGRDADAVSFLFEGQPSWRP
jgi:Tol biopolymer transport system component